MKKFFIALFLAVLIAGLFIFINRYKIVQYSAEKVILSLLPPYLNVEGVDFDLQNNSVTARRATVANPAGFSEKPILEVESLRCRYKPKTSNILDGIDIVDLAALRPTFRIERLADGRINFQEMKDLFAAAERKGETAQDVKPQAASPARASSKNLSELLGLPDAIYIKEGRVIFVDNTLYDTPYILTFDNIKAAVSLKLNDEYSKVLSLTSSGSGRVGRRDDATVDWAISLNPTTPKLTMSNNFKVANVDILPFQPYFLRYSPFVFRSGRFSGDLVFDFDNGNIGSTNTVQLEALSFQIREGYEGAAFWQTTVPDLVKYLTSTSGAVIFDFKIKGEMSKPDFYLGPISKQAIASMTIDKITDVVSKAAGGDGSKTDLDKVQDVVDIFKGILKKK